MSGPPGHPGTSLDGAINAPVLIRFLQRLIRDARVKVFLIPDNLPVHRARLMQNWLAKHTAETEVFHLLLCSPELNPDKDLNSDLKQAITCKPPACGKRGLTRNIISRMRRLSRKLDRICSYFGHHTCRYAA